MAGEQNTTSAAWEDGINQSVEDVVYTELIAVVRDNEEYADELHPIVDAEAPYLGRAEFHDGFHDYHLRGGAVGSGAFAVALANRSEA